MFRVSEAHSIWRSLIADTRFVDKAYEKTQIGDDVQLVELASDKFHYPEGLLRARGTNTG